MAKAAKEIQMENPSELEAPNAGTPCPPLEEQAEKPSVLCFKKRKKSCKKGLTSKDTCEGASAASEEKSQCINTEQGEAKASAQLRPSRGAWAALKSLTKPQRRQKSSSRKKASSDSQVQLEMDAEESCVQGLPRKKAGSGLKMPCVRFLRGKKKPSPSEVVEESEDSAQANEVMGILNKAIEELEDMAEPCDKDKSPSPLPAEDVAPAEPCDKDKSLSPLPAEDVVPAEPCDKDKSLSPLPAEDVVPAEPCDKDKSLSPLPAEDVVPAEPCDKDKSLSPLPAEDVVPAGPCGRAEALSPLPAEDQDMLVEGASADGKSEPSVEPRPDVDEHTECIAQSEIPSLEPVNEPVQEKLPEGGPHQSAAQVEEREVAPEVTVSTDEPSSTPEITEVQETATVCKELPETGESERSTDVPVECKSEETVVDFSPSVFKDDAVSVQSSSSHQEKPEVNMGTGVGIVITVTEAVDSDDTDSDQAYEPSLVLHHNKQKGNKKSSGSFDFGQKEGPGAGSGAVAEEKGLGDQGHRTSDQYELLLIETASSLVKAAIQSSIEQLVNEMALEQNKHNSFL
ncbi:A-kinase anchor protein 5 [Cyrtonyx montezumae]|uniref:A-kinase anchor protein 5 n=1 Tax=Cyrtonyx montezumae TaxID=9017 RepID=UPI0032DB0428